MMHRSRLAVLGMILAVGVSAAADPEPVRREWTVGDARRESLIHAPASAKDKPTPVVFAFHGHGGTMKAAANNFAYHRHWPGAICVYMQGLPTPGKLTDPEGKRPGWQHNRGEQGDRDLAFFDAVLKSLRADYKIDDKRIYATGHSNGGRFTYLLWAERGEVFAAVAPSASPATRLLKDLKPKPCLHVAGEKDQLVAFASQKRSMDAIRKLNGCPETGKPWDKSGMLTGTEYPSEGGTPLVTLIHPGDHKFPSADAPKLIVKFFQQHPR
jgi:polyhydroxybutyrate depolymerase